MSKYFRELFSLGTKRTSAPGAYGYLEGVGLDGFLRAAAQVVGGEADGVDLRRAAEGHLGRSDGGLGGLLVVAVDEVGRQQDGDDEGQQQGRGDDGFARVVTDHL